MDWDTDATEDDAPEAEEFCAQEAAVEQRGYSSGERQLQVLTELVEHTRCRYYPLDEWDANLDAGNRERARPGAHSGPARLRHRRLPHDAVRRACATQAQTWRSQPEKALTSQRSMAPVRQHR